MLDLIESILILLSLAIGLGEVFTRLDLPEVVGAIMAGIILGPALFGVVAPSTELSTISLLALFFIIIQIGIESSADIFTKNIGYVTVFAIGSFIFPFLIMTAGSVYLFHLPYLESVSMSLSVSIPSISITSVLLVKSGLINTEDGQRLLGGVAMSDVVAFIILVSFHRPITTLIIDTVALGAFVVCLYLLDVYLKVKSEHIARIISIFNQKEKEGIIFAIVILIGLGVSTLFEFIDVTFVLGAFFSGMIIHQNSVGEQAYGMLKRTFQRINTSFFIPMFFSISGLEVSIITARFLPYLLFLILITTAIGGFAAYQFSKRFMKGITPGVSLGIFGGRGAVGIIIASIALSDGFMNGTYYSIAIFATVVMAIVFTYVFEHSMKKTRQLSNSTSQEE